MNVVRGLNNSLANGEQNQWKYILGKAFQFQDKIISTIPWQAYKLSEDDKKLSTLTRDV